MSDAATVDYADNRTDAIDPHAPIIGKLPPLVAREPFWKRGLFLLVALTIAFFFYTITHLTWVPAHSGVDQNGYLVGGKMFADHFSTRMSPPPDLTDPTHQKVDEFTFVGPMWIGTDLGKPTERYYPKYPIGLPVLVAAALKIGGPLKGVEYAHLISPLGMALALVAIFLLMRQAVNSFAAILGMLIVAACPVTLGLTNNPNSHGSTLAFVCWGMYFLVRWWQKAGWWRAAVAGLLLGYAVTIRYTEALLLFPLYPLEVVPESKKFWHVAFYAVRLLPIGPIGIVVFCNLHWRRGKSYLQALTLLACWGLPVALLLWHNYHGFGKLTGYDPTNESEGFRWEYFMRNWDTMLRQMHNTGLFFILPLGLAGQILLCVRRLSFGLAMLMWTLPSLVLYTFYYWAPESGTVSYLRFFLTIIPPLALGTVWLLSEAISGLTSDVGDLHTARGVVLAESDLFLPARRKSSRGIIVARIIATLILATGAAIGFYYVDKNQADSVSAMTLAGYLTPAKGIVIAMSCIALAFVYRNPTATAGLIVAIATGIGANLGLETLESEFARNDPVALAAQHVVAKVPAHSIVFSAENLLNHLQFAGDYQLYSNHTFGGLGFRTSAVANPNDPQLVQPDRAKMWVELMKGKSENDRVKQQRALIAAAIGIDQRVFIALPTSAAETFKRTLTGTSRSDALLIESKITSSWVEPGEVRRSDRGNNNGRGGRGGGAPQGGGNFFNFGRGAAGVVLGNGSTPWEIVELTLGTPKPPIPIKPAATQPVALPKPPVAVIKPPATQPIIAVKPPIILTTPATQPAVIPAAIAKPPATQPVITLQPQAIIKTPQTQPAAIAPLISKPPASQPATKPLD